MSRIVTISGTITSTDFSAVVGAEIWIDQTCVLDVEHVDQVYTWQYQMPASVEGQHRVRYVMKGKNNSHVEMDSSGQIVKEVSLQFTELKFDDLDIQQMSLGSSVYTHDFNGNGLTTTENYGGYAGCNGTIDIYFSLPYYIWYLENR